MRRFGVVAVALGLGASVFIVACQPSSSPIDIYSYAGRCEVLKDATTGRFVARDVIGYRANATQGAATRFRLQATALGRYLLYATNTEMPQVSLTGVSATKAPGPTADWRVTTRDGRLGFTSFSNGKGLSVTAGGRLGQSATTEARWSLVPADGCAAFPEVQVNATGTPLRGASPTAQVKGFLDAHTHISAYDFLGGRFHCGRPWSPYGVTVALKDCVDHQPNGAGAVAENFFTTGTPVGTHDTHGWPTFAGWPKPESLTHEGTYWKWVERAWRGGLRLLVDDLVENRALCEIYPLKQNDCNEMASVRKQAKDMAALQDYIDAQYRGPGKGWFRIVRSPAEARRVINSGKLAVVLGVEISEVLGCGNTNGTPDCDRPTIDKGLDELYRLGVRSFFPVHKFDNALGGVMYDNGGTGLLVNVGNKYATGSWWQPQACPPGAAEHDNSPTDIDGNQAVLEAVLGEKVRPILGGDLPSYPNGPLCNPKGLTALGAYVINGMIDRGMIVETDHMGVKTRSQALDIIAARHYPGVISSHSWGDMTAQHRIQALGGVITPYGHEAGEYIDEWKMARAGAKPGALFGTGWGSDTNGLGPQPEPRVDAFLNPVVYPFRTFDGGTVMNRLHAGTKVYDINVDGVPNYGLRPDYVQDLRDLAGNQIVTDLSNGAEVYLRMWAKAQAFRN
jgi:microsomal dipeptidase-like Zn-dependent dipeptidase